MCVLRNRLVTFGLFIHIIHDRSVILLDYKDRRVVPTTPVTPT